MITGLTGVESRRKKVREGQELQASIEFSEVTEV